MTEINVEKIMEEIREDIKRKGYKESDLSFNDIPIKDSEELLVGQFNANELERTLHNANVGVRVDFYKPIEGNALKKATKKLIRKIMKPVLYHLCESQERYNANVAQTLNQLYLYIQKQEAHINDLERLIAEREK